VGAGMFSVAIMEESIDTAGIGMVFGVDDSTGTDGADVVFSLIVVGGWMSIEGVGKTV
jgi:hypothetical protein